MVSLVIPNREVWILQQQADGPCILASYVNSRMIFRATDVITDFAMNLSLLQLRNV